MKKVYFPLSLFLRPEVIFPKRIKPDDAFTFIIDETNSFLVFRSLACFLSAKVSSLLRQGIDTLQVPAIPLLSTETVKKILTKVLAGRYINVTSQNFQPLKSLFSSIENKDFEVVFGGKPPDYDRAFFLSFNSLSEIDFLKVEINQLVFSAFPSLQIPLPLSYMFFQDPVLSSSFTGSSFTLEAGEFLRSLFSGKVLPIRYELEAFLKEIGIHANLIEYLVRNQLPMLSQISSAIQVELSTQMYKTHRHITKKEIDEMKAQIAALLKEREELLEKSRKFLEMQEAKNQLEKKIGIIIKEKSAIQSNHGELSGKLQAAEQIIVDLKNQLQLAEKEKVNFLKHFQNLQDERTSLRERINQLEGQKSEAISSALKKDGEKGKLSQTISELDKEKEELTRKNNELENKNKHLAKKAKASKSKYLANVKNSEEEKENLENLINELKDQVEQSKNSVVDLNDKLQDMEKEKENLLKLMKQSQDGQAQLANKLQKTKESKDQLMKKVDDLEKQNNDQQAQIASLNETLQDPEKANHVVELEKINRKLDSKNKKLESQIQALNDQFNQNLADLIVEQKHLLLIDTKAIGHSSIESKELSTQVKQLSKDNSRLQKKLSQISNQLNDQSTSPTSLSKTIDILKLHIQELSFQQKDFEHFKKMAFDLIPRLKQRNDDQTKQLFDYQQKISELQQTLDENQQLFSNLKQKSLDGSGDIPFDKEIYSSMSKRISSLEQDCNDFINKLYEKEQLLSQLQNYVSSLEKQLKSNISHDRSSEINNLQEQIQSLEKENQRLSILLSQEQDISHHSQDQTDLELSKADLPPHFINDRSRSEPPIFYASSTKEPESKMLNENMKLPRSHSHPPVLDFSLKTPLQLQSPDSNDDSTNFNKLNPVDFQILLSEEKRKNHDLQMINNQYNLEIQVLKSSKQKIHNLSGKFQRIETLISKFETSNQQNPSPENSAQFLQLLIQKFRKMNQSFFSDEQYDSENV